MSKRKITTAMKNIPPLYFERSLGDLATDIQTLIDCYGKDARLDYDRYHYESKWDNEPSPCFWIYVDREETQEEYDIRMAAEMERQAAQTAKELAEFERLSKKFGKS
jgi:hypothetical protein